MEITYYYSNFEREVYIYALRSMGIDGYLLILGVEVDALWLLFMSKLQEYVTGWN